MAKVSDKNQRKKSPRKRSKAAPSSSAAVGPDVVYDDGEEELNETDDGTTSEEDADGQDERRRQKLVEAIGALGGKRKKSLGERSEAAVHMSEFSVNSKGEADRIDLSELIGTVEKTAAVPNKTKKQLQSLQRGKRTIECPLSKQESQRIQRDLAFQKAATEVSRWNAIISQNQRAEQLVFPLNQEPAGPRPMERVVTGWTAQTPLEKEVFALLAANKQPINDPILTPAEEASVKAMSLEEAQIRRAELQKARALQSYYEAKARRERKIKSKKYHRVQNKSKRKEFLKQFEDMVQTDPAAALDQLQKMEVARMQERMSLKHQNSGKWAKSKAIMAKYDEGARKAMQQQLEVNKDLTQKLVNSHSQEENQEEEEGEDAEVLPDFVNDAELGGDSANPWMRGKLSNDPLAEVNELVGLTAQLTEASAEEEEEEETEEEALLREFDQKRRQHAVQNAAAVPADDQNDDEKVVEDDEAAAEDEDVSDKEQEVLSEFTNIFRGIMEGHREAPVGPTDTSALLKRGHEKIEAMEDTELLTPDDSTPAEPQELPGDPPAAMQTQSKSRNRKKGIALKEVLMKETKVIKVPLAPTNEVSEGPQETLDQRVLIKEAFAGDDVVSDFLKEKRKLEDAGKTKDVSLILPGWGEWGGTGLKLSRGKRKQFRIKAPTARPRKDQRLPTVIISEKRSSLLSLHQVNALPFPFETHRQFESTVRSPLGRTWNTEQTVRKVTKPRVVTHLGTIIEPMEKETLVTGKRQVCAGLPGTVDSKRRKH